MFPYSRLLHGDGSEVEFLGGHWSAHEVPLRGVAAQVVHQRQGIEVFYPLGDDAQAERVRQVDRGADDRHSALVPRRAAEKRSIELQFTDRKPAHVRQ